MDALMMLALTGVDTAIFAIVLTVLGIFALYFLCLVISAITTSQETTPSQETAHSQETTPSQEQATQVVSPNAKQPSNVDYIWIPQVIISIMLFLALNPENPYGYYILLRWACCGVFGFLAFRAAENEKWGWVWVLGGTALFYNPIIPVHLTREIWTPVNIATAALAITSIFISDGRKEATQSESGSSNVIEGE